MPRDPRGIVLLCGYVAAAAFGLVVLLTPPTDPIGFGYLAVAAIGYFFIQTRGLTTFLWLLVAGAGVLTGLNGGSGGWVEFALGLALAMVAVIPLPEQLGRYVAGAGMPATRPTGNGKGLSVDSFGSSGKVEISPPSSGKAEVSDSGNGSAQSPTSRVAITTIGRLRLEADGRDLTQRLKEQPRLEFLVSYLLARTVRGGDGGVDRSALADEIAPGLPAASQRDRLRKQIYALQRALGPGLKALLDVRNTHIRLRLDGVDSDFGSLVEISRLVARRRSLLDPQLAERVRSLLDETVGGEFLPGFSELEQEVTEARGTASQVVEEARSAIASQNADLVKALADYNQASGHPQASIAYLRAALITCPGRQDLARLLVAAYLQTGQTALATQVGVEFDLTQEK